MGRLNAKLIAECERTRKAGDPHYYVAAAEVDRSQEECPHPIAMHRRIILHSSSPSGKYQRGGEMVFCRDCSGVIEYTHPKTGL